MLCITGKVKDTEQVWAGGDKAGDTKFDYAAFGSDVADFIARRADVGGLQIWGSASSSKDSTVAE